MHRRLMDPELSARYGVGPTKPGDRRLVAEGFGIAMDLTEGPVPCHRSGNAIRFFR